MGAWLMWPELLVYLGEEALPVEKPRKVRVLMGAFTASPYYESQARGDYMEAELLGEQGNGAGQHYICPLTEVGERMSPLWVFDSYIHPEDRKTLK